MDLRQTVVLVLSLCPLLVSGQSPADCSHNPGWFGSSCQYKCRCSDKNCTKDGVCRNDVPCQKRWFGPACQYADLAYNRSSAREATDGDDNTCLTTIRCVTVPLGNRYHVTWLRVRLSKPDFLYNLTVHFREDASLSCTNIKTVLVDNTTLDIHCDLNETVGHVTLLGPGVHHLCSVYISGERNVALKQHSSQSSTYEEHYKSEKALDSETDQMFYRGHTCSHTKPGDPNPNMNITFSTPQHVTRYILYNRNVGTDYRLEGFELRSFGPLMTPVFNYTDRSGPARQVYVVVPGQVTSPIHLVNIAVYQHDRILTLCELEIYGDTACQPGQYGRECEHSCNCDGDQSCFVSTGECPSGCAAGFLEPDCQTGCDVGRHGLRCGSSCSQFCARDNDRGQHFCDNINGTCLHGCQSGYQGSTCAERCDVGSHGPQCLTSCSQFCAKDNDRSQHFCDNINGTCLLGCQSGYQGSTCAEKLPSNVVLVVVAVLGGVGVLVLVMVAVRFHRRHTVRQYGPTLDLNDNDDVEYDESNFNDVILSTSETAATYRHHQVKQEAEIQEAERKQKGPDDDSTEVYQNVNYGNSSSVVPFDGLAFDDFVKLTDNEFFENQFSAIPNNQASTMTVGQSPDNKDKDICP